VEEPWCDGDPTPAYKGFFHGSIFFGTRNNPVQSFTASGDFLNSARLTEYVQQIRNENLKESEVAKLLTQEKMFGPNERKQFIKQLPLKNIKVTTGCQLNPKSAHFDYVSTGHSPPDLHWVLYGTARTDGASRKCEAFFEPIAGRLIHFAQ
jgi:hypothetical protein